jgi:hypothetical protein
MFCDGGMEIPCPQIPPKFLPNFSKTHNYPNHPSALISIVIHPMKKPTLDAK